MKNGKRCCSQFPASCPTVRNKNSQQLKKIKRNCGFTADDRKKARETIIKKTIKRIFINGSVVTNDRLKHYLIEYLCVQYECAECGLSEWNGKFISLELHHINGVNTDNRPENLQLLCPNCHSQTDTWRGRNKNTGQTIIADDIFISELKKHTNIRQTLLHLKLSPKGANYIRAKKLLKLSLQQEIVEVDDPNSGKP